MNKIKELKNLIGNTPLIEIFFRYNKKTYSFYAKLEWYNFTGSIKDRVVYEIINNAYKNNLLQKGQELIEVTSGNTGISLAAIGNYLGHKVNIILPDWLSNERKTLLKLYNANLILVNKEQGGFLYGLKLLEKYPNAFRINQFDNEFNTIAHEKTTAVEIYKVLNKNNKHLNGVVAGVGTGGTLMGLNNFLSKKYLNFKVYAIEPESSQVLKGKKGNGHKIEGISDEFIPPLYKENKVSEILDIKDDDAIYIAQKICKCLGLGVGISSGANAVGAIKKSLLGEKIVTVFTDDNKKYLSTDLNKHISINSYLNDVEFLYFKYLK